MAVEPPSDLGSTSFTLGSNGSITVATGLAYTIGQAIVITHDINNFQVMLASYTNQAKFIFYYISFAFIIFGFLRKLFIKK